MLGSQSQIWYIYCKIPQQTSEVKFERAAINSNVTVLLLAYETVNWVLLRAFLKRLSLPSLRCHSLWLNRHGSYCMCPSCGWVMPVRNLYLKKQISKRLSMTATLVKWLLHCDKIVLGALQNLRLPSKIHYICNWGGVTTPYTLHDFHPWKHEDMWWLIVPLCLRI